MVDPFGFIVRVFLEPISFFGADTPIYLSYLSCQVSFKEISDQRLKRLLHNSEPLVILVVKLILGHGHLSKQEYLRDNSHISSIFVASLLDNQIPKAKVMDLTSQFFKENVLVGLDLVLKYAILGSRLLD